MRRPVIESGTATVIVYASRAGEGVTALDLIKACENRERHMKGRLQKDGKMVTQVDRLSNELGDIEIIAKWVVLGEKRTKAWRKRNAGDPSLK